MPAASVGARRSPGTATPMPSFMVLVCCAATVRKTKASERIRPLSVTHRCVKPSFSASVTYSISSNLAQVSPNSMLRSFPFVLFDLPRAWHEPRQHHDAQRTGDPHHRDRAA